MRNTRLLKIIIAICINSCITIPKSESAERITFQNGIFNRTITVKSIEQLAKTGKTNKSLENMIKFSSI